MRFILCLSLVSVVLTGVSAQKSDYNDPDAFAVYSAVIKQGKFTHLTVFSSTTVDPVQTMNCHLKAQGGMDDTLNPVIDSYIAENKSPRNLAGKLDDDLKYEGMSPAVFDELRGSGFEGWDRFHLSYPDSSGVLEWSAVGFNRDRTVALVYYGLRCGPLCGHGGYIVLEKKQGKWFFSKLPLSACTWDM